MQPVEVELEVQLAVRCGAWPALPAPKYVTQTLTLTTLPVMALPLTPPAEKLATVVLTGIGKAIS